MRRLLTAMVLAAAMLVVAPPVTAKPRVTANGDAAVLSALTATVAGGKPRAVVWERCPVKKAICPAGKGSRVGKGTRYEPQPEDIDAYLRAVVKVKSRAGVRTVRSAWVGPVRPAATPSGEAKGMQVGEYTCYSGTLLSTVWIDSGSTYRSPSGTKGTYALDPASSVYTAGAVKINWTSGVYAEWQTADNFWAEYVPAGVVSPLTGQPVDTPTILMTFAPGPNLLPTSSGWTTCNP